MNDAKAKIEWANKIGNQYRVYCFLTPLIITIRLGSKKKSDEVLSEREDCH